MKTIQPISVLMSILFFSFASFAQSTGSAAQKDIDLRFVKDFVVSGTMPDMSGSNRPVTVQDQLAKSRDLFRTPPGSKKQASRLYTDMVYVMPGGLEASSGAGYDFSFTPQLGCKYKPGSFTFSGWAGALVYIYRMGWGTENQNGDFMPYLIQNDYQEVNEPCYEFVWQNTDSKTTSTQTGAFSGTYDPAAAAGQNNINLTGSTVTTSETKGKGTPIGGSIYLNYMFRVPKNSSTKWADDLALTRFSFAGAFSTNAPAVQAGAIVVYSKGNFRVYGADLKRPSSKLDWTIPSELRKVSSFAVSASPQQLFVSDDNGKIYAMDFFGRSLWSDDGLAPLIVFKKWLIGVSPDYKALQVFDKDTGKFVKSFELPRFLPRDDNSIAIVNTTDSWYLFFQIPRQSRILCYRIENI